MLNKTNGSEVVFQMCLHFENFVYHNYNKGCQSAHPFVAPMSCAVFHRRCFMKPVISRTQAQWMFVRNVWTQIERARRNYFKYVVSIKHHCVHCNKPFVGCSSKTNHRCDVLNSITQGKATLVCISRFCKVCWIK